MYIYYRVGFVLINGYGSHTFFLFKKYTGAILLLITEI